MVKQKTKKQLATGLAFDGIICSGLASWVYAASLFDDFFKLHNIVSFSAIGLALLLIGLIGGKAFNELSK